METDSHIRHGVHRESPGAVITRWTIKNFGMRRRKLHEIMEFDMKHINLPEKRLYTLCGIGQYTSMAETQNTIEMGKISESFLYASG